jgi:antitoxin (DNA-binding transcriptional repressor) of toxin-antitoxin stability system
MKPTEAGIFEVKTHLSEFISKVENGESFLITKRGKPVAELRPPERGAVSRPKRGYAKGSLLYMAPDFSEPLDDFKEYME